MVSLLWAFGAGAAVAVAISVLTDLVGLQSTIWYWLVGEIEIWNGLHRAREIFGLYFLINNNCLTLFDGPKTRFCELLTSVDLACLFPKRESELFCQSKCHKLRWIRANSIMLIPGKLIFRAPQSISRYHKTRSFASLLFMSALQCRRPCTGSAFCLREAWRVQ